MIWISGGEFTIRAAEGKSVRGGKSLKDLRSGCSVAALSLAQLNIAAVIWLRLAGRQEANTSSNHVGFRCVRDVRH
jgi:formylglycine-generating enzyme required for sulfatase activity